MSEFIDPDETSLGPAHKDEPLDASELIQPGHPEYSAEEKELLRKKVDISSIPKKKRIPGTLKNRIEGLTLLGPDSIPVAGRHFVVWGSAHLDDIKARPVKRSYPSTENEHASREIEHTKVLLALGLKNPKTWTDPATGRPGLSPDTSGAERWDRVQRTEHYARWRYRGFVAGEIAGL